MAVFKCSDVKEIKIGDTVFKIKTEDYERELKGYQYDSLVYRYIRAREQMAEYEFINDSYHKHNKDFYYNLADRDILRFCQILNDVIGEHD